MKLALIVTPENPIPPSGYGGAERVAYVMVNQLMKLGHEVDLYCAPDSTVKATRLFMPKRRGMSQERNLLRMMHTRWRYYDCIIDYAANHLAAQTFSNSWALMGGDPYRKYPHDRVPNRVYVSREFAKYCDCPEAPVLPNPVHNSPSSIPLGNGEGSYILYVGHVGKIKDLYATACACRLLRTTLRVYGPMQHSYINRWKEISAAGTFQKQCFVDYRGILRKKGRWEVFGEAEAFVHPTLICDADPCAPKESMLCGTPVVASPMGGVRSSVEEGVGGYFAFTAEGFRNQIQKARKLDRKLVRESIMKQVNPGEYGRKAEALCNLVRKGDSW